MHIGYQEKQIFEFVAKGFNYFEISSELPMSKDSISDKTRRFRQKYKFGNDTEAILYLIKEGLIDVKIF